MTFRAKSPERLKAKIIQRNKEKNYQTEENIRQDIMDFSGVRIALYFPADRKRVESVLKNIFDIVESKNFPNEEKKAKNRFDGYHATHYRVKFKSSNEKDKLDDDNPLIEIQVASVLMHAWSEVNHDLGYKQLNGELSQQENSVLDGVNGLVLVGEGLLEQLQTAFQNRIAHQKRPFANQYELAAFLYERFIYLEDLDRDIALSMENIDTLYDFLEETLLDNPKDLSLLLEGKLDGNVINFPVFDQVLDIIFEKDIDLFDIYYDLTEYDGEGKNEYKKIIKNRIFLKRYIICVAYYKNYGIL